MQSYAIAPCRYPTFDDCWIANGPTDKDGYVRRKQGGRKYYAHRRALENAIGRTLRPSERACHTCDAPACVRNDDAGIYVVRGVTYLRFGHLWLGTPAANMHDSVDKRRRPYGSNHPSNVHPERLARGEAHYSRSRPDLVLRGERHGQARLTEANVRAIRVALAQGETQIAIGKHYGVSNDTIWRIAHGKIWRHVT